jgi:hypothetical protein
MVSADISVDNFYVLKGPQIRFISCQKMFIFVNAIAEMRCTAAAALSLPRGAAAHSITAGS